VRRSTPHLSTACGRRRETGVHHHCYLVKTGLPEISDRLSSRKNRYRRYCVTGSDWKALFLPKPLFGVLISETLYFHPCRKSRH
jgi:hypothetical protein